jgi:hypothetical protein
MMMKLNSIPIPRSLVGYLSNISGLLEMDRGDPPLLTEKIDDYYLQQGLQVAKQLGDYDIMYLAIKSLLKAQKQSSLVSYHSGEQEWSEEEMRWVFEELDRVWFPDAIPDLDRCLPFVQIQNLDRHEWRHTTQPILQGLLYE